MNKPIFRIGKKVLYNYPVGKNRIGIIKSSSRTVDGIFYTIACKDNPDGVCDVVHEKYIVTNGSES